MKIYFLFGIYILVMSFSSFAKIDYAKSLMTAFGSGCRSNGTMTIASLGHSFAIEGIIETARNDSECTQWANNISALVESSASITDHYGNHDVDKLRQEISDLEEALTKETNTDIAMAFATILAQKKIDLIASGKDESEQNWNKRIKALNNFTLYASSINTILQSDSECFSRYPALVMQLGGQILAMSGSVNIWGSVIGAGITSIGATSDIIIKAIKGSKFNRELKGLKASELTESLLCTFEKLSSTYCSSKAVADRIELAAESDINIFDEEWKGIYLMKSLPTYNRWISHVIAGSPSEDTAGAGRKEKAIKLKDKLDILKEYINATITVSGKFLSSTTEEEELEKIRAQLVKKLLEFFSPNASKNGYMRESDGPSPFVDSFVKNPDCGPKSYFYTNERDPQLEIGETCDQYLRRVESSVPEYSQIIERSNALIAEAKYFVDKNFSMVKETDPIAVLVEGEKLGNYGMPSPIGMLIEAETYVSKVVSNCEFDEIPAHTAYMIQVTRKVLHQAIEEFDRPLDTSGSKSLHDNIFAKEKIERLQKILAPDQKESYLNIRLRHIVNFEIEKKLEDGEIDGILQEFLILSLTDDISTIENFAGVDINQVRDDTRGAMKTSFENLNAISGIFDSKIKKIFNYLKKRIKKYPDVKSFNDTLNNLCAASLSVPGFKAYSKKTKLLQYCEGRILSSIYPKSNIELKFDDYSGSNFSGRVCQYYDYMRRNYLYQIIK